MYVGRYDKVRGYEKLSTTTKYVSPANAAAFSEGGGDLLQPGIGVYTRGKNGIIDHLGVYVGSMTVNGVQYTEGVVSSSTFGEKVHITELNQGKWEGVYLYPYVDDELAFE